MISISDRNKLFVSMWYFVALKIIDDVEQQAADSGKVPCNDTHDEVKEHQQPELAEKIRQYESGEKGKLNAIFAGSLRHWLDHCCNLGKQLCMVIVIVIVIDTTVFVVLMNAEQHKVAVDLWTKPIGLGCWSA